MCANNAENYIYLKTHVIYKHM